MSLMRAAALMALLSIGSAATSSHPAAAAAPRPEAAAPADSAPPRLSHDVEPTAESVELWLDPTRADYRGRVTIQLAVREPSVELRFHTRALTLDSAAVRGPAGEVAVRAIERLIPDQTRIRLAAPLPRGAATLTLRFHNAYNTRAVALYRVATGGNSYLFTQFEDTEAREAFPCWDEPAFKIPWNMTLIVPQGDLAVGNTKIARETPLGAERRVEFARTRPLPSYLVAVAVGPFDIVPIRGLEVPGRVITVHGAAPLANDAARVMPAILKSLERYFGRPYPYEKLDLIAAPEFLYGAMENAGAIVFADRLLLLDPATASPAQRHAMTSVIAHETAHQWFGDYVTMRWWDDLWLNESFANWMASKVMREIYHDSNSDLGSLLAVERAFDTDARLSTRAIRQPVLGRTSLGQTASELTYDKGQAVLEMFEGWLGADRFRRGVLAYLDAHAWGNATADDLWLALGQAAGQDIVPAMASFLDQPGVPIVSAEPLPGGKLRLTQKRLITLPGEKAPSQSWGIPLILRIPSAGGAATRRVWLAAADTVIDGVTADWVLPKANATGYYRWSVPEPMLDRLVAARASLSVLERAELASNLGEETRAGLLPADHALALLRELASDSAPEVTRAVVTVMDELRIPLTDAADAGAMNGYLRGTFGPALHRFGMRPVAGEPAGATLMRPDLLRLLARAEDRAVIAYAESLDRAYRRDPGSVPPSLGETAVLVAAEHGDRAEFEDTRRRFESTPLPAQRVLYLTALGSFRDPDLERAALAYSLDGPLRPQETTMIPFAMSLTGNSVGGRGAGGRIYPDLVTDWVLDHFQDLAAHMPPNFSARLIGFAGGCSEARIARLRDFFAAPEHQVLGSGVTVQRLEESIRECAALHDRDAARVSRWLTSHAAQP